MNWFPKKKFPLSNSDSIVGINAAPCNEDFAKKHNGGVYMDLLIVATKRKLIYWNWPEENWCEVGTNELVNLEEES